MKRCGITVRLWRLLAVLWDGDTLTVGQIAELIVIEQSSTTRLIDRALASGFVTKEVDPSDRRRVVVRMTDVGRAHIADLIDDALRADAIVSAEYDAAETEKPKAALGLLIQFFDSRDSRDAPLLEQLG